MTLKEKLLESLEQERKAIDAAIFLIRSSKALDAISLGGEVGRDIVRRHAERSSTTPPNPTIRRATDTCARCGRERQQDETGQAFGAHKRHCAGAATPPKSGASPLECPTCHADDFKTAAALGSHKRSCDGVRRTAKERAARSQQKWASANGGSKAVNKSRDEGRKAKRAPVVEDDDLDFDADEDMPNAFARQRVESPKTPPPTTLRVRCDACDESFPDAKSMGIHKTQVHFGR